MKFGEKSTYHHIWNCITLDSLERGRYHQCNVCIVISITRDFNGTNPEGEIQAAVGHHSKNYNFNSGDNDETCEED